MAGIVFYLAAAIFPNTIMAGMQRKINTIFFLNALGLFILYLWCVVTVVEVEVEVEVYFYN